MKREKNILVISCNFLGVRHTKDLLYIFHLTSFFALMSLLPSPVSTISYSWQLYGSMAKGLSVFNSYLS